eukprot:217436-Amphidinium_carterae.1
MQTLMNTYLGRNPVRAEGQEWPLVLNFVIRSGGQMDSSSSNTRLQTIREGGAPKGQTQKKQPRSRSRSPVWHPEADVVEEAEEVEQGFHMEAEEPEDTQVWNLTDDPDLEQRALHVSVGSDDPITISVPLHWPDPYVERILAKHMGVKHEWLHFEWIWDDLFVVLARSAPAHLKELVLRQFMLDQEESEARADAEEEQASEASPPAISTPIPKPSGIKPLTTPPDIRQPIGAPRSRPEATPAKAMPKHTPATYGNSSSSGTHANSNSFESNVLARLDTIEKQQAEVLRLLRDTLRPLVTKPLATAEAQPMIKAKPTASPTMAAINASRPTPLKDRFPLFLLRHPQGTSPPHHGDLSPLRQGWTCAKGVPHQVTVRPQHRDSTDLCCITGTRSMPSVKTGCPLPWQAGQVCPSRLEVQCRMKILLAPLLRPITPITVTRDQAEQPRTLTKMSKAV